ncbi:protein bicaudal D homolog 2-like isoform X2 [Anneissia japonica]|uniref:protein bicaudal D homolog 2-like isoform X2 n=1 Tax=Anneissia japonica TaxID=1529436 RepID=UPI001425A4E8|nr:protein bicaudal D homolog 2-like isoform X2 [Anneissia japonica]XP_033116377.1 protein bicaudal D homolog 2-like isoform X2 [Anneissia japonica]XP_033116378.1 protein bicaudal D homolog 2-like isoform X2 [Anneissia japonica]XP_033116379.1 protein bicaudal D homolog 2-like isoform X2 [Anneissia japonica]XP_033116381.1 protein bicaudal D homolog 2-like isoform X2 [Anneissia japonica]
MSDSDEFGETIEELNVTVVRLRGELDQAQREKIQAAEYGLVVLEEKQSIKAQLEDLDKLYETTRQELRHAKEALEHHQQSQKKHTAIEVHREESLLQESATREADLLTRIADLELEVKQSKQQIERYKSENEHFHAKSSDSLSSFEKVDSQRKAARDEVRELKFRETRLLQDYSELEEENIAMQKQVSSLKSSQVEYEALKHENRRLIEDAEFLNSQIEDLVRLKEIAEKQVEETLKVLESEREQKHALKKELDQAMLSELEAINEDLENRTNLGSDDDEPAHPILQRMEIEYASQGNENSHQAPSLANDLFSELHSSEIQKLEVQVKRLLKEKSELSRTLERSQSEISNGTDLHDGKVEVEDLPEDVDDNLLKVHQLIQLVRKYECKYNDLKKSLESEETNIKNISDLQEEIKTLTMKEIKQQENYRILETKFNEMSDSMSETQGHLDCTQDELVSVSEDISQLYQHVCVVNGENPHRIMLDHFKATRQSRRDSFRADIASRLRESKLEASDSASKKERKNSGVNLKEADDAVGNGDTESNESSQKSTASDASKPVNGSTEKVHGDPITCLNLITTVKDQIKYLKRSVEHTVEVSRKRNEDGGSTENEDLQEQVVKLKSLLTTKREQVATLRTVLKANKTTAEVALSNLKSKYQSEKQIIAETMMKLRGELKALKEDAATFTTLRAMFASRCDEYVTQLDEYQRQLLSAEEEKKTLNSLLRMAIQQKLALTQRLEDLEFRNETQTVRKQTSTSTSRKHRSSKD